MREVTLTIKALNTALNSALQQWRSEEVDYAKSDVTCAARQLSFALSDYYGRYNLESAPLPESFVEAVKRHAIANLVDSTQDPLEMTLKVLESYHKDQLRYFEKNEEIAKVIDKVKKVIPLLLRAMQTEDDSDLLEISVDLLEVHLSKLAALTK